jgi:Protein of unknown function (DUF3551)
MVKIMTRIVLSIIALAVIVCCDAPSSQAGTYGDAPWCAVQSLGTGEMEWDCEYATADACAPAVVAGNKGFCNENPYFVAGPPPVGPWHPIHHRRHHVWVR